MTNQTRPTLSPAQRTALRSAVIGRGIGTAPPRTLGFLALKGWATPTGGNTGTTSASQFRITDAGRAALTEHTKGWMK